MTTYQETTHQEPTHQETKLQETLQEPEWHPTVAFHRAQVLCVSAAVVAIIVSLLWLAWFLWPAMIRETYQPAPIVHQVEQPIPIEAAKVKAVPKTETKPSSRSGTAGAAKSPISPPVRKPGTAQE